MSDIGVSDAIYSNSKGWFRYNYNQSRLEFINNETKLVVQTWAIPIDQWDTLPSQRQYCENIVNESNKLLAVQLAKKQKYKFIFKISRAITVILVAIYLYLLICYRHNSDTLFIGSLISFLVASSSSTKC